MFLAVWSIFIALSPAAPPADPCASCHPKEVEGYAKSAMAHSIEPVHSQPAGSFTHAFSGTTFTAGENGPTAFQSFERHNESGTLPVEYAIGSGHHAAGYLVQIAGHLFQSPIAYYTKRRSWDMAPGYEQAPEPDFSRPVTLECLFCHSDKPLPVPDTLNTYQTPPFAREPIWCDRCHGPVEFHLKRPIPGSILNPARLSGAVRDSICEQCHLAGEVRIPNPGKTAADFLPGQRLEDVYTVYVLPHRVENTVRVISQSEQLALSVCARSSGGKLWCGTCHNPHDVPARPAEYYRERCLTCHGATLEASHAAPGRNCIACHMPPRPAKDGGHTAFTDHRIARHPEEFPAAPIGAELTAWREPEEPLRSRNLALALVTAGVQNRDANQVIRGYRMLNRLEQNFSDDPVVLTALGNILLKGKQPAEAEQRFERALRLRPRYAPYEVNLAGALLAEGNTSSAIQHLERAVQLDPLLYQAVELLSRAEKMQGNTSRAEEILNSYRKAMGIRVKPAE